MMIMVDAIFDTQQKLCDYFWIDNNKPNLKYTSNIITFRTGSTLLFKVL